MDLYGKDFIVSQEWSLEELKALLDLAAKMKRDRYSPRWTSTLAYKTFMMFFYNPSVRTRMSFEAAATELGGHAQFMTPSAGRFKTEKQAGETIEDAAQVMARYVCGIGIRILEDKVPYYGAGNEMLREYAQWSDVPIVNMADDKFHPCQGMADVMGWAEWFGEGPGRPDYENLKGKNFLLTWGSGALARSWCSVQEALLVASRFGMNVTVARPDGYDLDPEVYDWTKQNCAENGTDFDRGQRSGKRLRWRARRLQPQLGDGRCLPGWRAAKAGRDRKGDGLPGLDGERRADGAHRQWHLYPSDAGGPGQRGDGRGRQRAAQRHL